MKEAAPVYFSSVCLDCLAGSSVLVFTWCLPCKKDDEMTERATGQRQKAPWNYLRKKSSFHWWHLFPSCWNWSIWMVFEQRAGVANSFHIVVSCLLFCLVQLDVVVVVQHNKADLCFLNSSTSLSGNRLLKSSWEIRPPPWTMLQLIQQYDNTQS